MNTNEVAAEYRLTHWAQVMHERVERGLSIRAYCEDIGIHENTYFYWQRKLREAACSGDQAGAIAPGKSLVPNGWTQLTETEPETVAANTVTVEVGGYRIIANAETDMELLAKVCRALKSL